MKRDAQLDAIQTDLEKVGFVCEQREYGSSKWVAAYFVSQEMESGQDMDGIAVKAIGKYAVDDYHVKISVIDYYVDGSFLFDKGVSVRKINGNEYREIIRVIIFKK